MITQEQVDLFKYPNKISTLQEGDELTIGDLHGNSIKLLFFLIKQGVLTLKDPENDYNELVRIYKNTKKPEDELLTDLRKVTLKKTDIDNINNILQEGHSQNQINQQTSTSDLKTILEDINNTPEQSDKMTIILNNRLIKNSLEENFNINQLIQIFNNYRNNPPTTDAELKDLKEIASNHPTNKLATTISTIIDKILSETDLSMREKNIEKIALSLIKSQNNQTQTDINKFKDILASANFTENAKSTKIRLIGDELADRGNNDYFTLLILDKFNKDKALSPKIKIIFSNHGANFVKFYEAILNGNEFKSDLLPGQNKSLFGLMDLIDRKIVNKDEITRIITDSYKPNLRLISYAVNKATNPITFNLYSHAPIDLTTIKTLATKFKTTYDDSSAKNLAKSIDAINKKFNELVNTNMVANAMNPDSYINEKLNELVKRNMVTNTITNDINKQFDELVKQKIVTDTLDKVIHNTIWNTNTRNLQRITSPDLASKNYPIHYAHGHCGEGDVPEHDKKFVTNFDNSLGKQLGPGHEHNIGEYTVQIANSSAAILKATKKTDRADTLLFSKNLKQTAVGKKPRWRY